MSISSDVYRHFAWFHAKGGHWLGEWAGRVPAPEIPPQLIGEARQALLNAWQQAVLGGIEPFASVYPVDVEIWDEPGMAACPSGGAVCIDVSMFNWPVGHHRWHTWDDHERRLRWDDSHHFLQIDQRRHGALLADVNSTSSRPVLTTPQKLVLDLTGTPLEAEHGALFGPIVKRDGRILIERGRDRVDLGAALAPSRLPHHEVALLAGAAADTQE